MHYDGIVFEEEKKSLDNDNDTNQTLFFKSHQLKLEPLRSLIAPISYKIDVFSLSKDKITRRMPTQSLNLTFSGHLTILNKRLYLSNMDNKIAFCIIMDFSIFHSLCLFKVTSEGSLYHTSTIDLFGKIFHYFFIKIDL
jgi:hypothetical protein